MGRNFFDEVRRNSFSNLRPFDSQQKRYTDWGQPIKKHSNLNSKTIVKSKGKKDSAAAPTRPGPNSNPTRQICKRDSKAKPTVTRHPGPNYPGSKRSSKGRVLLKQPLRFWSKKKNRLGDFVFCTHSKSSERSNRVTPCFGDSCSQGQNSISNFGSRSHSLETQSRLEPFGNQRAYGTQTEMQPTTRFDGGEALGSGQQQHPESLGTDLLRPPCVTQDQELRALDEMRRNPSLFYFAYVLLAQPPRQQLPPAPVTPSAISSPATRPIVPITPPRSEVESNAPEQEDDDSSSEENEDCKSEATPLFAQDSFAIPTSPPKKELSTAASSPPGLAGSLEVGGKPPALGESQQIRSGQLSRISSRTESESSKS